MSCPGSARRCRRRRRLGSGGWLSHCRRLGPCHPHCLGHDCFCRPARCRRRGHGWFHDERTGDRPLDRCLLQRLHGRRPRGPCGGDLRWHEHGAQIGRLDPALSPGEAYAGKPQSFTEGQAQQQRVHQQREQECERHPPAFGIRALPRPLAAAGGSRRSRRLWLGWRCPRGTGTYRTQACSAVPARALLFVRGRVVPRSMQLST